MDPDEYQKLALRTLADQDMANIRTTIKSYQCGDNPGDIQRCNMMKLLHGAVGASTEIGELLSEVEKVIWFGKSPEGLKDKIKGEIGDVLWYIAVLLDSVGLDFNEVMEANIRKLKARYPERFSLELSENRDVSKEEQALKGE